jgi:hypothetical protein
MFLYDRVYSDEERVLPLSIAESRKRWFNRHPFQQRTPLSVQYPTPHRSTMFPSPTLLGHAPASFAQGENGGGLSGGHSESFTAVNIHEVQNIIVWCRTLLSLYSNHMVMPNAVVKHYAIVVMCGSGCIVSVWVSSSASALYEYCSARPPGKRNMVANPITARANMNTYTQKRLWAKAVCS